MQWVCWVEIQGLYAAAAQVAGLAEVGRPVVVLRGGRVFDGCRDAFVAGLQLGSPAHQVLRDVPRAVQIDLAEIDASQAARSWWDRCLAHTPYVEPVEPHQVLLALPLPEGQVGRRLQQEVKSIVDEASSFGFVAFAGVGASRLVARAAAQALREEYLLRRPGAAVGPGAGGGRRTEGRPRTEPAGQRKPESLQITIVPPGEEAQFLAPLPIGYLPCPPEVRRRLSQLGLKQIGEAARVAESEWVRQLGAYGRQVYRWSRGIDPEPVKPAYPPRRFTHRTELGIGLRDRDLLERELNRSALLLANQLERRGEGGQLVALVLELTSGQVLHAERTLQRLQHTAYPLQQGLQLLLGQLLNGLAGEVEVAAVTAEVGLIGPINWRQMELWDDQLRWERQERLEGALALLRERFPGRVIGLGPRAEPSWREQMLQFADPYRWPRKA